MPADVSRTPAVALSRHFANCRDGPMSADPIGSWTFRGHDPDTNLRVTTGRSRRDAVGRHTGRTNLGPGLGPRPQTSVAIASRLEREVTVGGQRRKKGGRITPKGGSSSEQVWR
jgi:hypothetical protein